MKLTNEQLAQRERLKRVLAAKGIGRERFATILGNSFKYINQVLSGNNAVSEAIVLKFSKSYTDINPDWIMTGQGEMFLPQKNQPENGVTPHTPEERVPPLTLDELTPIIRGLEREVGELRREVEMLKRAGLGAGPGKE